ncbi:MAG: class I SAM-dependent methyltransferase [Planctomycetales bacterium]
MKFFHHVSASAVLILSGLLLPVGAQQESGSGTKNKLPPALTHYKGRQIAQTMHDLGAPWLVRESRNREEDTQQLLRELKLKPGQAVCDIGCGNGFYTLPMAKAVGEKGRVLAVDIQPQMLKFLKDRAAKADLSNIELILGTLVDPRLPKGKLDAVLLVDVYHEFSHPEQMLRAIRESLNPTGVVVLAEFRMEDPKVPIKLLHKMSKKQIMKEFPANGFRLAREYDELPWQHLMFFQRDDAPRKDADKKEDDAPGKDAGKKTDQSKKPSGS